MEKEKILLVGVLAVGLAVLAFGIASTVKPTGNAVLQNTQENFKTLSGKQIAEDKCAVPPGTDPQQWREHLSHHPDLYAECLK